MLFKRVSLSYRRQNITWQIKQYCGSVPEKYPLFAFGMIVSLLKSEYRPAETLKEE
jgi:hypothetical protein